MDASRVTFKRLSRRSLFRGIIQLGVFGALISRLASDRRHGTGHDDYVIVNGWVLTREDARFITGNPGGGNS